jgi:hypothetical protein
MLHIKGQNAVELFSGKKTNDGNKQTPRNESNNHEEPVNRTLSSASSKTLDLKQTRNFNQSDIS